MKRRAFLQAVASTALVATVAPGVLVGAPTRKEFKCFTNRVVIHTVAPMDPELSPDIADALAYAFRDLAHPPMHVNCRCVLVPITVDDLA